MKDILTECDEILNSAGFDTMLINVVSSKAVAFEDATVLGFVFAYDETSALINNWSGDADSAISHFQFGFRKAGQKAWNTYVVLLAEEDAGFAQVVSLGAVEEDLSGTRKIVRAGVKNASDIRSALLPLLPIQSAPHLEAVNIIDEIRQRTTELSPRAVEAFLSDAEESLVIRVFEEHV